MTPSAVAGSPSSSVAALEHAADEGFVGHRVGEAGGRPRRELALARRGLGLDEQGRAGHVGRRRRRARPRAELGADLHPQPPHRGHVPLAPLDRPHRRRVPPGRGLDPDDEALHPSRARPHPPERLGQPPRERLQGGRQLLAQDLGLALEGHGVGQGVEVPAPPPDGIAGRGLRRRPRPGDLRLEVSDPLRRGLRLSGQRLDLRVVPLLVTELSVRDVGEIEDVGGHAQRLGQFGVLRRHVELVQPVEQAALVPGVEDARLPGPLGGSTGLGLGRFDDEDPWTPAAKVEAGEDLVLGAFHVDLADVDGAIVEPGFGQQIVERSHRYDDRLHQVALGLASGGLGGDERAEPGVGHEVELALARTDCTGGHGKRGVAWSVSAAGPRRTRPPARR